MKKLSNLLIFGIAACLFNPGVPTAQADLEVSASVQIHADADFYAPLSSCGTWVDVGSYGRCWRPIGVVVGWRPYCNGDWVWTDCGWYWASDEPWAWACYHYGYWVYDSTYGWIWVPGTDWAPAWVCWRFGGGFVGWAPMPPPGAFFVHHPDDSAFVFVNDDHFNRHITPATVVVSNPAIIRETKFVSGAERTTRDFSGVGRRNVYVNKGPGLGVMEKATGKRFTAISVRDAARRTPLPSSFRHKPAENRNDHQPDPAGRSKTYAPSAEHYVVPPNQGGPPSGERRYEEVHPAQRPVPVVPRGDRGSSSRSEQGQAGGHGHGHGHD